jgi:hypothetical protein
MSDNIIQNAAKITDGTKTIYLQSCSVHDYVSYQFDDGVGFFAVDGGKDYARRAYSSSSVLKNVENYCLSSDSSQEDIQDKLLWGSLADGKVIFRPIKDLTMEHLKAVLETQHGIGLLHKKIVTYWLSLKTKQNKPVKSAKNKSSNQ